MSRGSVATEVSCSCMFINHFNTNFPQNVQVKKIWKSVTIWRRYGQRTKVCWRLTFWATLYMA